MEGGPRPLRAGRLTPCSSATEPFHHAATEIRRTDRRQREDDAAAADPDVVRERTAGAGPDEDGAAVDVRLGPSRDPARLAARRLVVGIAPAPEPRVISGWITQTRHVDDGEVGGVRSRARESEEPDG